MTAFIFITEPILRLFGAEGDVLALGKDYLDVIVLGAAFQIFATGIVPIIRNNGGSVFAFITMMSGFAANILLDYLFVWVLHRGTEGAAIATILGQAITAIEAFAYLLFKKLPLFGSFASFGKCAARIAKVGIAPFGLRVSGIGAFPNEDRPSVVWLGAEPAGTLRTLADRLADELRREGIGFDAKPFKAHVTVARSRDGVVPRRIFDSHRDTVFSESLVREILVMRSDLGPGGAKHTVLASVPLLE